MADWRTMLPHDPVDVLLSSDNKGIVFYVQKDLLGNMDLNPKSLWVLPGAQKIVNKQQRNGSWKYQGGNSTIRSEENYDQIETFRNLGYLVESFGFNKNNPVIEKAANFLFRFQTDKGDIRGILGNQYTPYYTAAILELLIKSGYADDDRVKRAFEWLDTIRQNDGGWAIPFRTRKKNLAIISTRAETLEPDRSKPFSHMVTGIVLRAYAAHDKYRNSSVANQAGKLLLSSLFKKDNYPDRRSPGFWLKFTFPFWFTDLISAMDSLSVLGFQKDEPQIQKAIQWFGIHQGKNGLWKLKTLKNKADFHTEFWLSLAICRILKRMYH